MDPLWFLIIVALLLVAVVAISVKHGLSLAGLHEKIDRALGNSPAATPSPSLRPITSEPLPMPPVKLNVPSVSPIPPAAAVPPGVPDAAPGEGLLDYAKRVGLAAEEYLIELRTLAKHHPGATWPELVERALNPQKFMTQADLDTVRAVRALLDKAPDGT